MLGIATITCCPGWNLGVFTCLSPLSLVLRVQVREAPHLNAPQREAVIQR